MLDLNFEYFFHNLLHLLLLFELDVLDLIVVNLLDIVDSLCSK